MVGDLNKCKGLLNPKIKFMDEYILNLKINTLPRFNRKKKVLSNKQYSDWQMFGHDYVRNVVK